MLFRVAVVAATAVIAGAFGVMPIQDATADPSPSIAVVIPANDATVSGLSQLLDAVPPSGTTTVQFEITGGSLSNQVVATATPTIYGWLAKWNTTTVANGAYSLVSVATDADGNTDTSTPIGVSVDNAPPSTSMLVPTGPDQYLEGGVNLSGDQWLDASASPGVSSVVFTLYGGPDHAVQTQVAVATPTIYGWLAKWNTAIPAQRQPHPQQ